MACKPAREWRARSHAVETMGNAAGFCDACLLRTIGAAK
jgi:hypothetical protein